MPNYLKLISSIALCQLAGVIGTFFTFDAIPTWYAGLTKPFFSPPNWLFGPVWLTLYTLMGIAFYLIWSKGIHVKGHKNAIIVFLAQLILNALWSIVFFGAKMLLPALGIIIVMWALILTSIILFSRESKIAAWLLVPYLLWVSFASVLNGAIWWLN